MKIAHLITVMTFFLAAQAANAASVSGSNTGNVTIPDAGGYVSSTITISIAPAGAVVTGIDVYFKCVHTYSGDLTVDLNADSTGSLGNRNLWNREGGSADNPTRTTTGITTFNGLSVNRTWYLYAKDFVAGDSGYIDEWTITIYYSPPVTPTISSVSPAQPVATGSAQPFTITGTSFISTATVDLEDVTMSEQFYDRPVSSRSGSTGITINPNFGTATVNHSWRVRVNNGSTPSTWFNFTVVPNTPTPTISSVSPAQPVATGSAQLFTITGTSFISTATVDLEDVTMSEQFYDRPVSSRSGSTGITINPNFGTATVNHSWRVRVNNGSTPSTWFNFTVVPNTPTPTISSVSPAQPVATGSAQPFTITGTSFISTATVDLEDVTMSEQFYDRPVSSRSGSTGITINPNFGTATVNHSWRVRVNNGSTPSTWFNFTVVAPNISTTDGFDYPIGAKIRYTGANDGDGWYVATEFNEYYSGNGKYHLGEDWNAESGGNTDYGSPIYAIANGTIVFAGPATVSGWGNVLIIRHKLPDGTLVESLYGHVASFLRTSGNVARGEQVATIGDGGGLYSAHLHLEVRFSNCPYWGSEGVGYSVTSSPAGWTDPSDFIDAHRPGTGGTVVLGVDVSYWNGSINWAQVSNPGGKTFALIRATAGVNTTDSQFAQNAANAYAAGLLVGTYHFAYPEYFTAHNEAQKFLSIAGAYIGTGFLPPALDIEDSPSEDSYPFALGKTVLSQWIRDWCFEVKQATGVTPMIYTTRWYANNYFDANLNQYLFWVPTYSPAPTLPNSDPGNITPWSTWTFQQYQTDPTTQGGGPGGTCPGISGYADLDSFNGDLSALQALANQTPTSLVADLNNDNKVDFADFALFANHWMYQNCAAPSWCQGSDFDHSGSVGMLDLATFATYWLESR